MSTTDVILVIRRIACKGCNHISIVSSAFSSSGRAKTIRIRCIDTNFSENEKKIFVFKKNSNRYVWVRRKDTSKANTVTKKAYLLQVVK